MSIAAFWARRRLSSQIAMVVATSVIVCALLIVTATQVFAILEQIRLIDQLPPAARRAIDALMSGREPRYGDFRELIRVQGPLNASAELRANLAIAVFTLAAAGIAFFLGRMLASRLGRGLENVAAAARMVAEGGLTARAEPIGWSSVEERQLIDDFNAMAIALNEAERELHYSTAAIVHELRTPLTVLNGRLSGIRDGVFEAGPEQIDSLIRQVDSLARIVEDLRILTLAESHEPMLHHEAADLADVVRSLVSIMEPDLTAAGLVVDLKLAPAPIIADPARLRQALTAVLTNVIRYAPNSGTVTIATRLAAQGAVLTVLDNGPGLSPAAQARAFDRFWRADESRARISGGSGLGLAVVRAIAVAHNGRVSFRSRPEGGAAFEMWIPIVSTGAS